MAVTQTPQDQTVGGYRHEAFLYSGRAEFVSGTLSFIRRAVSAGDPVLVVVGQEKIDLLEEQLGAEAGQVSFADMAQVGDNPGRIIAVWRQFVADHAGAPQLCGSAGASDRAEKRGTRGLRFRRCGWSSAHTLDDLGREVAELHVPVVRGAGQGRERLVGVAA